VNSSILKQSAGNVEHPKASGQSSLRLPSGPPGPGRFGAYYTYLKYHPQWDRPWRVGKHADVVVRFDNGGHRFVFWRGTSYIPCWVTDTGLWYTNEFVERRGHHSPNTQGCVEPMSDKQCRYSHVRIIESNNARVVVHWRYAPVDVRYEHPFIDPGNGWFDWVDEYYTVYPNAVGVRKITLHSSRTDLWTEFQESIVVNQPGALPDDCIELGAVSVCNMNGQSRTYVWGRDGAPEFDGPKDSNILRINLKSALKPFALVAPPESPGRLITGYRGHAPGSHFNWWDHWPVSLDASDGRVARNAARPSHSSLCHIGLREPDTWKPYAEGEKWVTKLMVHGMTGSESMTDLVPLARSWVSPPQIMLSGDGFRNDGYDPTQMAYRLTAKRPDAPTKLVMEVAASTGSPLTNPAFVVANWGERGVRLKLNGRELVESSSYRVGHRHTLDSTDLVVWLELDSAGPIMLELEPSS